MYVPQAAQVVLQVLDAGGAARCEGLAGIPATNPAVITLLSDGSAEQSARMRELRDALDAELQRVGGAAGGMPSCGRLDDLAACAAWTEALRRKVVVVVCDGTTPLVLPPAVPQLDPSDEKLSVIPVVPLGNRTTFAGALGDLSIWNAEFWNASIAETVPAILARAGLIVDRPRIFISYRQTDTAALAAQLFDSLSHKNCDVFLDHFRIEAGVDFQARLTEELGDKSMFVLLESPAILDSKWVRYEIAKATALGIGRVALTVPGGKKSAQIAEKTREVLGDKEFAGCVFNAQRGLTDESLERVTQFILREHARALFWRRASLQNSMLSALRSFHVPRVDVDYFGALHVRRSAAAANPDYIVWLSTNPPGLPEFYGAYTGGRPPAKGVVVGPAQTLAVLRRRQTTWLASRSNLTFVDEGLLRSAARRMASGTL